MRVTKLGHTQRGGAPGVYDRLIASQLGAAAVDHIAAGEFGLTLGIVNDKVTPRRISELTGQKKPLNTQLLSLAQVLTL
jgi:6-phosphofructokinase 1